MPNATRCNAQMLSKFGSNFIPPSLFVILLHLTQNGHSTPHNTHTHRQRMGCGSSRPDAGGMTTQQEEDARARAKQKAAKEAKREAKRKAAEAKAAAEAEARRSSTSSETSGNLGTSSSSLGSASSLNEAEVDALARHGVEDPSSLSPRTRNELLRNCTFRPATNAKSKSLAARARARGAGYNTPLFERLAGSKGTGRIPRLVYRPSKDDAYDEYVGQDGPGRESRAILRSKIKTLKGKHRELAAVSNRLKEGVTGAGPSGASGSYKSVLDKVNHLNRTIALLTAGIEQMEHKLFYAFEEWYAKNKADLPDPPSPRSQAAATKIQAVYRGYRTRARPPTPYFAPSRTGSAYMTPANGRRRLFHSHSQRGGGGGSGKRRGGRRGGGKRRRMDEEEAAVVIQAAFRGYQTRRHLGGEYYADDEGYDEYGEKSYDDQQQSGQSFRDHSRNDLHSSFVVDGHWDRDQHFEDEDFEFYSDE